MPTPTLTGTITLDQENPSLGDVVTFTIETSLPEKCKANGGPRCYRIEVIGSQDGVQVYLNDANHGQQVLLGGGISDWVTNGGPADCVATLYTYTDFNPVTRFDIASVAFAAGG